MERDEVKTIVKEALEEFFSEMFGENWYRRERKSRQEKLPPSPIFRLPEKDLMQFRHSVRELNEISESYRSFLLQFKSWAHPPCSEKKTIGETKNSVDRIESIVNTILTKV